MLDAAGINQTNTFYQPVTAAYNGGYTTNTAGWPFGFFLSAQVCGSSVADWALTRSTAVYPTTVGTNGPTVPAETNGDGAYIPAIYAQAYQGGNGKRYVVLTNKGSNAVPVQITQDGAVLTNQFLETFVAGSDPSATNSSPQNSPVQIQSATATNPVLRFPDTASCGWNGPCSMCAPPNLALTASNQVQNLHWTGLTNVTYNVQGITNLLGNWTTLGRMANTATNFSFTNWNSGPQQFYRLAVP